MTAIAILGVAFIAAWLVAAPQPGSKPESTVPADAPDGPLPAPLPPPPPDGGQALTVMRDGRGQFRMTARIEGEDVDFLVDTGASVVALTVEQAERLGLDFDRAFEPVGEGASGPARGARVRLDRVEIAGREFHGVDALVIEGLATNLLGQSLLGRLGHVTLRGDRMEIRP